MFCVKCGNELRGGSFCAVCGTPVDKNGLQQPQQVYSHPQPGLQQPQQVYSHPQPGFQQPQQVYSHPQPGFQQPQQVYNHPQPGYPQSQQSYYQAYPDNQQPYTGQDSSGPINATGWQNRPDSFTERLHSYGSSALFMTGIILFTAGNLLAQIFAFSVFSIISIILLALPVIGFWLLFAASKRPSIPEKALPALTLFKVSVVIGLAAICLIVLLLLVVSIALLIAANGTSGIFNINSAALVIVGVVFLVITCCFAVYFFFYYKSLLGLLNGIRKGIVFNSFVPLPGVKVFSVMTYISIGASVLGLINSAISLNLVNNLAANSLWNNIPSEYINIFERIVPSFANVALSSVFSIAANAGVILCVIVLNRFSNSITRSFYTRRNQANAMRYQ